MIMDDLRKIAEEISDEIDGAECYLHSAMHHKSTNPNTAKRYAEMAEQEAGHASTLYSIGLALAQASDDQVAKEMWETWSKPMLDNSLVKIKTMREVFMA